MQPGSGTSGHVVVVVGAGPAGMALAKKWPMPAMKSSSSIVTSSLAGWRSTGFFPSKTQTARRSEETSIGHAGTANVHYFGNVSVGRERPHGGGTAGIGCQCRGLLHRRPGARKPSAWKVTPPRGVFHAKDVVYHFNRLPGFGDRPFDMGKHGWPSSEWATSWSTSHTGSFATRRWSG